MHFLPASRTKRRLLKVASLGLAGLIAGLLSGCSDSRGTTASTPNHSSDSLSPDAASSSQLPKSIEATQIPALRHPPSSRSLQYGTVRTASMTAASNGRSGS
jgi:hypothetical protein